MVLQFFVDYAEVYKYFRLGSTWSSLKKV